MKLPLLILAATLAAPVKADILVRGQASVSHTFELRWLDQAPEDTKLFVYPADLGGHATPIEEGMPFTFYKHGSPHIYAYRGELPSFPNAESVPGLPRSSEALTRVSALPEWRATRRIHTVYGLHMLEGDRFKIELVSETHYDADGDEIQPRAPSHSDAWMLLPVAALLAAGIRVARRGRGKSKGQAGA